MNAMSAQGFLHEAWLSPPNRKRLYAASSARTPMGTLTKGDVVLLQGEGFRVCIPEAFICIEGSPKQFLALVSVLPPLDPPRFLAAGSAAVLPLTELRYACTYFVQEGGAVINVLRRPDDDGAAPAWM